MLGPWLCRLLLIAFGYIYPAYLTFKALERGRPDSVRTFTVFWLVMALFTVGERLTDVFLFWVPLYHESKVLFVVYLWHSQGATYLYDALLKPQVAQHEAAVDQYLEESKAKARDLADHYSKRAYDYVQKRSLEVMAYYATSAGAAGALPGAAGLRARAPAGAEGELVGLRYNSPSTAAQAAVNGFTDPAAPAPSNKEN